MTEAELDEELAYLRDERLGMLGACFGMNPTKEQLAIVNKQLADYEQEWSLAQWVKRQKS